MVMLVMFGATLAVVSCNRLPERYTNSIGIRFIRIDPGTFMMGSETVGDFDERPVRRTRITKPFLMGVTEVTNAQYEIFDPGHRKLRGQYGNSNLDDEPVVMGSWQEAMAFCQWLSEKEDRDYRLPTEAEWEYACRAGTTTTFNCGDSLPDVDQKEQKEFQLLL